MTKKAKRNLLKKYGSLLAATSVIATAVVPSVAVFANETPQAENVTPQTKSADLSAEVVTPQNLLVNPTGVVNETNTIDGWSLSYYNTQAGTVHVGALDGKNKDGDYFSLGTNAWISDNKGGGEEIIIRTKKDDLASSGIIAQKFTVKKGQTYQVKFKARDYDGYGNRAKLTLQFGYDGASSIEIGESTGFPWATTTVPKSFTEYSQTFTATEDGEAMVRFRTFTNSTETITIGNTGYTTVALKDLQVKNTDVTPPATPTITSDLTTASRTISGTAEADSTVLVYNFETGENIGEGTADANGNYTVTIKRQLLGQSVVVKSKDFAGNISAGSQKYVSQGEMDTPTIAEITNADTAIPGTADPASSVFITVKSKSGTTKVNETVTADNNGNYRLELGEVLEYLDTISVYTRTGTKQSETATATVTDSLKPTAPIVDIVAEGDSVVTGTATPGNKVVVTDEEGTEYTATVDANGKFEVNLNQILALGETVTVKQVKDSGLESEVVTVTAQKVAIQSPVVDPVKDTDTLISGTGEAYVDVTANIFDKNNNLIGTVTGATNSQGKFTLLANNLKEAAKIEFILTKGELTSRTVSVDVVDTIAPEAPYVAPVVKEDTTITGTAEDGVTVIATVAGTEIGRGIANGDGDFSITIEKQELGTEISVVAVDKAANESAATSVVVGDVKLAAPIVNEIDNTSTRISGIAIKNSTIAVNIYSPKGELVKTLDGEVGSDGKFLFDLDAALVEGSTVEAIVTKDGLDSKVGSTVVKDVVAPNAPTLSGVTEYTEVVTGTSEPGTTIILTANGREIGRGFAGADGQFMIDILKQSNGVVISAVAKDAAGNQSNPTSVVVAESQGTIDPQTFVLGESTITGSYTGDVARGRLTINGEVVSWGGTFENGTFSYYVGSKTLKSKDQVVVLEALDSADKVLDTKTISVQNNAAGEITAANYNIGASKVTGTYTGDVSMGRLIVDGKVVSWGGTFENGEFSYYVTPGVIWSKDQVVTIDAYDQYEDKLSAEGFGVNLQTATAALTEINYKDGSSFITGAYTGEVTKARLTVNNKVVSWGGNFENGEFSYYVNLGNVKKGDVVSLDIFDDYNNKLNTESYVVDIQPLTGSVTFNPAKSTDAFITGTYTGDVSAMELRVDGKLMNFGGEFKEDGTFSYYIGGFNIQPEQTVTFNVFDRFYNFLEKDVVVDLDFSEGE